MRKLALTLALVSYAGVVQASRLPSTPEAGRRPALHEDADDAVKRRAIETNLATAVPIEGVRGATLEQRMKELGVPALSYAVVENGKVVLAAAYGEADVALGRRATPSTLFQAASLSKPVTAMAAMELVERGKLRLDEPVNSILRSWKLPENELTAKTPVTLRLLLSHSAGTTVHGFPGYGRDAAQPAITQVLEGTKPANTKAIVVDLAPNTKYRYSGGGTTVAQVALADHTAMPFADFMRRTVLGPLGMTASTYQQPLPPSRRDKAATAYAIGKREVDGKWHVYPEQAAAGLWTTPTDLGKVIIELQNALAGRPTKLLSIDAARHMLTPRFEAGPGSSIGIGFFIDDRGGARYFSHGGSNEGFRATIYGAIDGSKGVVVMANSDTASAVITDVLNSVAREYQFPGFPTTPLKTAALREADLARFPGRYEIAEPKQTIAIRRAGERLEIIDLTTGWQPLYPLPDGSLARADRDTRYALSEDGLTVTGRASTPAARKIAAKRLPADSAPSADELLSGGEIDRALAAYREQFRSDPKSLPEDALNRAGYAFVGSGRLPQALALLRLNTELYPTSANTWDSLSEALIAAGDTAGAIAATEEMLRLLDADPKLAPDIKELMRGLGKSRSERLREPRG